jgi:nitrate reductase gamma subunit
VTSRFISIIMCAATLALLLGACPAQAQQAAAPPTEAAEGRASGAAPDAISAATGTDAVTSASGSRPRTGPAALNLTSILMGPAFILAWLLFVLGCAWRVLQFMRLTRLTRHAPAAGLQIAAPGPEAADRAFLLAGESWLGRLFSRYRRWERGTVFGAHPVMARVSLVFHLLLFLVPLLLPAHNALLSRALGVSLLSLPAPLLDLLTLVFLVIGGFFLARRILVPRVRVLSTLGDYIILLLVVAPFVTAYAAHHRWLDYHTLLMAHTFVGEALIAAIPFTKLGHMPFLIFSRFFTASEYSLKTASRRW